MEPTTIDDAFDAIVTKIGATANEIVTVDITIYRVTPDSLHVDVRAQCSPCEAFFGSGSGECAEDALKNAIDDMVAIAVMAPLTVEEIFHP